MPATAARPGSGSSVSPTYAFRHGRAWFVMLDNVEWLGPPVPVGANTYRGRIGERGLAFLRNLLAEIPRDDLIVLAMHIPLHTDTAPDDPRSTTTDRAALLELLAGRRVLSLAGHTHTTEHHYLAEGHHHHVLTAVSGSWWSGPDTRTGIPSADSRDGTPNGFHVLSVRGTDYATRYVPAQGQPDETMRILFESELRAGAPEVIRSTRPLQGLRPPVPQDALADTILVVNVFDGGPRTNLSFRVGDRAPQALARTRRLDPFVTELFERYPETKKSWVRAIPSSHIWTVGCRTISRRASTASPSRAPTSTAVRSAAAPCWRSRVAKARAGASRRPPPDRSGRQLPRAVAALLDLLDDLRAEGVEIVGAAAGDDAVVGDHLLVVPAAAGVDHVGPDRREGGQVAALGRAGLDQQPGRVADGGHDLPGRQEALDHRESPGLEPELVRIDLATGQDQRIVGGRIDLLQIGIDRDVLAPVGLVPAADRAFALARLRGRDGDRRAGLGQVGLRHGEFGLLEAVGGEDEDLGLADIGHGEPPCCGSARPTGGGSAGSAEDGAARDAGVRTRNPHWRCLLVPIPNRQESRMANPGLPEPTPGDLPPLPPTPDEEPDIGPTGPRTPYPVNDPGIGEPGGPGSEPDIFPGAPTDPGTRM